ncbi:TerD family protein [Deinococcus radiophilus]|uniref:HNH nuclease domain-containing protein n=1 Tax=Deinococcus radiophilus TaxID=32062 RepID=A0A3S0I3X7_9DEIO|nr:TerD family protein [Deinococcus radiophilus]RTR26847.1 hypothetical protein EJ104_07570 [Deinococcus radiophilus]UFA51788.1 TerD family protein [Deinococcus radiophilus]
MTTELQRGQRLPLPLADGDQRLTLGARLLGLGETDLSVFGLDPARQLSDDRYFIFFNQPQSPEGAIVRNDSGHEFSVDLARLPLSIERLLLAVTTDSGTFAQLQGSEVWLRSGATHLSFQLDGQMFGAEQAVMLLEIYRHSEGWRVMAVGQGFSGGLQALLESLGGEVAQEGEGVDDQTSPPALTPEAAPQPQWQPLQSGEQANASAQHCRRCGARGNLINRLSAQGLCRKCTQEVNHGLQHFRTRFLAASADGIMELREWQDLQGALSRDRLDAAEALAYVRSDALNLLERTLTLARADGIITDQEEADFERLAGLLEVPAHLLLGMRQDIADLKLAARLREGHLPTVQTTIILDAGEVAHLECRASFRHVTASRSRDILGRLVVTSQKVHFISDTEGGWNVQYGKVLRIQELASGVNLELGVKKGSGLYSTAQPLILAATLDALVRIHKRLLLIPQTERASRSIPQKVKLEVWQRDAGRCVECGDNNYLEFDHVIPHSLGGATSVSNLQLLCRRCNLAKSNRI